MCGIVPYLFRARYLALSSGKGLMSRAAIAGELATFTLDIRPRCYNALSGADNRTKCGQECDAAGSGEAAAGAEPPGWDKIRPGTTNGLKARGVGAHDRAASDEEGRVPAVGGRCGAGAD